VFISSLEDENSLIEWKDDGIGLDEAVIQKFLAVIGKSYYHSEEFRSLGIDVDPISFFGIGLLSCFMITDSIKITTRRDESIFGASKHLEVIIPSISRYFRVQDLTEDNVVAIGTTLELKTKKQYLKFINSNNPITDFLCNIAGFVEFPILVHENDTRSVIISPFQNNENITRKYGLSYEIKQLSLKYEWAFYIYSEDILTAEDLFEVLSFNINTDLGLPDYQGILAYPVPKDYDMDFTGGSTTIDLLRVLYANNSKLIGKTIRFNNVVQDRFNNLEDDRQGKYYNNSNVYRDGILFTEADTGWNNYRPGIGGISFLRKFILNVPKTKTSNIDISRNQILTDRLEWVSPIIHAHAKVLSKKADEIIKHNNPAINAFRLASFMLFHNLGVEELEDVISHDKWMFPILVKNGVSFIPWSELENRTINLMPEPLGHSATNYMNALFHQRELPKLFSNWQGNQTLINEYATWGGTNNDSIVLSTFSHFINRTIYKYHIFSSIKFLTPPWKNSPPLLQEVWVPKKEENIVSDNEAELIIKNIAVGKCEVLELENIYIQKYLFKRLGLPHLQTRVTKFPSPYNNNFAYGDGAINILHPLTVSILKFSCFILQSENRSNISLCELRTIENLLRKVIGNLPGRILIKFEQWILDLIELVKIIYKLNIICNIPIDLLIAACDGFIKNSDEQFLHTKVRDDWRESFGEEVNITSIE
jgi:hypothetical protein